MLIEPRDLLSTFRFDLGAKLFFGRHYLNGIDDKWAFEVYKEHIRVFNNFVETDKYKIGIENFVEVYKSLIDDINKFGFDQNLEPVPVGTKNVIEDGAHRLSSCILCDEQVKVKKKDIQPNQYDYNYFLKKGLKRKYADQIALELLRWQTSYRILIVYPSVTQHDNEFEKDLILCNADIVYEKDIFVSAEKGVNYTIEIYKGEEWLGNQINNFKGAQNKSDECFPMDGNLRIYLLDPNSKESILNIKESLRERYGIGNHSVHSTDNKRETQYLANIFFHDLSNRFIHLNRTYMSHWNQILFSEFKNILDSNNIDKEDVLIHGSFLLSLLNIREARDIDILINPEVEFSIDSSLVGIHNDELEKYGFNIYDSIYNPNKYIRFGGYKIVSPDELAIFKKERGEFKDRADFKALNEYHRPKSIYSSFTKIRRELTSKYNKKVIKFYIKKLFHEF